MPVTPVEIYHVTMTAKVTVKHGDAEQALALAKQAILDGNADIAWTTEKDTILVFVPPEE